MVQEKYQVFLVSTDGGKNWKKAKLIGPDLGKFAWRQFVFNAKLKPGKYNIASKASAGGKISTKIENGKQKRLRS